MHTSVSTQEASPFKDSPSTLFSSVCMDVAAAAN